MDYSLKDAKFSEAQALVLSEEQYKEKDYICGMHSLNS